MAEEAAVTPAPVLLRLDRRLLPMEAPAVPGGPAGCEVRAVFDRWSLPDGHPFIIQATGDVTGTEAANRYLLAAHLGGAC